MRHSYLKEGILFFRLESVGTEEFETTCGFLEGQTLLVALKQFENIINNDGFQVNLFLVVEVFRLEFNLT